jgi:dTDP-4-amino-4,6-dideoxygalactose transaminase
VIKVGDYQVTKQDKQSILEVLNSGRLSEGKKVKEFEKMWAEYIGTKYCVLSNSGTSALMLALYTIKMLQPNVQRVLTSPLTFVATINAIVLSGLIPVFCDVDRETFVIIPEEANKVYADIFMPVHLYGYPVDMDKISKFKYIIEDACEAHGTLYNARKVGSIGLMGCFSFYIAHNIQVGDMGAITTNDKEIYQFLNKAKAHGRICECPICRRSEGLCPHKGKDFDPRFTFDTIAYNFKTSEFQATLGINQVKLADQIVRKRFMNVLYLTQRLSKFQDILQLPKVSPFVSYLAYPIIIKKPEIITRNKLRNLLEEKGIETRPLFACVPEQQPAYDFLKGNFDLPNAKWLGENGLHIGCHQYLTQKDLDIIVKVFEEIL